VAPSSRRKPPTKTYDLAAERVLGTWLRPERPPKNVVSMPVDVMCAICGQEVETLGVDPCALVVVANWRAPSGQQREQQFFAHAECPRSRMHPEVAAEAEVLG